MFRNETLPIERWFQSTILRVVPGRRTAPSLLQPSPGPALAWIRDRAGPRPPFPTELKAHPFRTTPCRVALAGHPFPTGPLPIAQWSGSTLL